LRRNGGMNDWDGWCRPMTEQKIKQKASEGNRGHTAGIENQEIELPVWVKGITESGSCR
jgi:hypothetical protein